jgi:hypothetical protein
MQTPITWYLRARPIPLLPPVTTATFPASELITGEYIGEDRCQNLKMGLLPGAFSLMWGSAFGAAAHAAVHGAVHDAFMTLPAYTRISEGEVQELGFGVRNGSHRALSDPLSERSERIERPSEAASPEGIARCASRGKPVPRRFLLSSCSKGSRGSPQRCAIWQPQGCHHISASQTIWTDYWLPTRETTL